MSEASSPEAITSLRTRRAVPLGKARKAWRLATIELASNECFLEHASSLRFQGLTAFDENPKPLHKGSELEKSRHEFHLIETHMQEPEAELDKGTLTKIATAVEVALARHIGLIPSFASSRLDLQAACEPTRNRPQPMRSDTCLMGHGVAH